MKKEPGLIPPYWCEDGKAQTFNVLLSGPGLSKDNAKDFLNVALEEGVDVEVCEPVSKDTFKYVCQLTPEAAWLIFKRLLDKTRDSNIDVAIFPQSERVKKLLVCDMDSTIVAGETLDDVADKIGVGKQVKQITERAMQGELDFKQALNERVSLLKDLSENVFQEIANEVSLNSGAEQLIRDCSKKQIRTVLVSGGFEPIVKTVAARLGFDCFVCNKLEIAEGKLTGNVLEPIVDGSTKLNVLKEESSKLGIDLNETCAVGDGANDLPMLQAAGLGIAYRGKPILKKSMPYQINVCGLDFISVIMEIVD